MITENNAQYQAEAPAAIVEELFSGKVSIADAIAALRKRLLDLSSNNRLLSYRFPKARSIQFADQPDLDTLDERLLDDNKPIVIRGIDEPPPIEYAGSRRPDPKQYARMLGIHVDHEFPKPGSGSTKRLTSLRVIQYPQELEKQLQKIASEARMIIEETGTNMLYLVFGFLEHYDSDDSEKPMLAPLLCVPVTLSKGDVDEDTRTNLYYLSHSGEDVTENVSLREKLSQNFKLSLPYLDPDDRPATYLESIERAVSKRHRWRVRYQLTLGFLSFARLAIWADLDPKRWPGLLDHTLLTQLFEGTRNTDATHFVGQDYKIDDHAKGEIPLIADADSSQHSAIIDVLDGKNLVINGPPGTGKSQTITNLIATSLADGKKVLFVSEKLAALEVVRRRLEAAGLGEFCLELHSNKTHKKKFIEDLKRRLDAKFKSSPQAQQKVETLRARKKELNRFASLMGSQIGNKLGKTINEVFWAQERRRQELDRFGEHLEHLVLQGAHEWSYTELEERRRRLSELVQYFQEVQPVSASNPWWGFKPRLLTPGDEHDLASILQGAVQHAEAMSDAVSQFMTLSGMESAPTRPFLERVSAGLQNVPDPSGRLISSLLVEFFPGGNASNWRTRHALETFVDILKKAQDLRASAGLVLRKIDLLHTDDIGPRLQATRSHLRQGYEELSLADLTNRAAVVEMAAGQLRVMLDNLGATCPYFVMDPITIREADDLIAKLPEGAKGLSIGGLHGAVRSLNGRIALTEGALSKIQELATEWNFPFDGSREALLRLSSGAALEGLVPTSPPTDVLLAQALREGAGAFSSHSISSLREIAARLATTAQQLARSLQTVRELAGKVGLEFPDHKLESIELLPTLANICKEAPAALLSFRTKAFADPWFDELVAKAQAAVKQDATFRFDLEQHFYLDDLPPTEALRSTVRTLRGGDGLFKFFSSEWRGAKLLVKGIYRGAHKLKTAEQERALSDLLKWQDTRLKFESDASFKTAFGQLFDGYETDFGRIKQLRDWFRDCQALANRHPEFREHFDLAQLSESTIAQLSARVAAVEMSMATLRRAKDLTCQALGLEHEDVNEATEHGLDTLLEWIHSMIGRLNARCAFFSTLVKPEISPARAVELLHARRGLESCRDAISLLSTPGKTDGDEEVFWAVSAVGTHATAAQWISETKTTVGTLHRLAESLGAHFPDDVSVQNALSLGRARVRFDGAASLLLSESQLSRVQSWVIGFQYIAEAVQSTRDLAACLMTVCDEAQTVSNALSAIAQNDRARLLVREAETSSVARDLLKTQYRGIETDLEGLLNTYNWGERLIEACAATSPKVCQVLLTRGPGDLLEPLRGLSALALSSYDLVRAQLGHMERYGSVNWDEWFFPTNPKVAVKLGPHIPAKIRGALEKATLALAWSRYWTSRKDCEELGLGIVAQLLEEEKLPPAMAEPAFDFIAHRSIARHTYQQNKELAKFAGANHDKLRQEYQTLDVELIRQTGRDFAVKIDNWKRPPPGSAGVRAGDFTEMYLLDREVNKQKRHIPIRQLVKRAGRALQELKPCFMMGPLSVAQYLEPGAVTFDLVVMDEASQLRPEDALGAIARGSQLVVVGDPKQLPPTTFFDRLLDAGDEDEPDDQPSLSVGMESILDICQQLFKPVRTLRWHYRSQHESLIAFSNHNFYRRSLVIFPSPYERAGGLGVFSRYVRNGVYQDRKNVPEAEHVVDAILEHMLNHPKESLGVVALNQTQRDLIEGLLSKKLREFDESQGFLRFHEKEGWPLFIKNLENVQGDERDVVFISTTFGKAPGTDKVRQNFGPISRADGWRRLNVLFTRARRRVELFTSMRPEDVIVDEASTPEGTRALRQYLEYAKSRILADIDSGPRDPDSDFEIAVANVMRDKGYQVRPQLGVNGYFIDIAVKNPDRPGEYLAGIECDGATYHSSFAARDRDRIRQEILESLGWRGRIHRIWSADWFSDPRRQISRLISFIEARRAASLPENAHHYDEFEMVIGEEEIAAPLTSARAEEQPVEPVEFDDAVDLYAEVGDKITYCVDDVPQERISVFIVDGPGSPKHNIINENAPLALAVLGLGAGERGQLRVENQPPRAIRVLKVERGRA